MKDVNKITELIIGAAIRVHKELGPGLLESAYEVCLCYELDLLGVKFKRQLPVPLIYKGINMDVPGFRADVLVEKTVLIDNKAITKLEPIAEAQMITYLKLLKIHVGLIINYHVLVLRDGIRRIVYKYQDSFSASSASSAVQFS
jgi:GxxExxY protein